MIVQESSLKITRMCNILLWNGKKYCQICEIYFHLKFVLSFYLNVEPNVVNRYPRILHAANSGELPMR